MPKKSKKPKRRQQQRAKEASRKHLDEVRIWLSSAAGLHGDTFTQAFRTCVDQDIESVEDLRTLWTRQKIHRIGFHDTALHAISNALSAKFGGGAGGEDVDTVVVDGNGLESESKTNTKDDTTTTTLSSYDTHDYSLHTNVGILHFKATHIHCGDALRERRLTLSREDPSGTLIPIVDEHDVATLLANKMLDDLHLDRCQNHPPLQHYTIQFSNERETHRIHITVCPYPECILQTPSKSSVCISFKEPVVVTDAESGTCHTLVHTVSPSQLRVIKDHFKSNVDTDEINTVFREIESTEAALHGARPDVTGISDEMLCKQFGEQCALRAKQLRDKEELDAQHAVDDVYR